MMEGNLISLAPIEGSVLALTAHTLHFRLVDDVAASVIADSLQVLEGQPGCN
jgi:hypothetical protein